MAVKYPITLSVSEPNNNIGLLKVRQADEESQTLVVQILEDAISKSYEGLQVFFCARIGQTAGLGIIEQKLLNSEMTDPKNGKLEYTFRAEDWQILGRQTGYFSFRKMTDDHTYVQQFTTRDFTYEVTPNIYSDGIKEVKKDGSTYVWTIEDLKRLYEEYIASGKSDWEEFVNQNREIIESIDPSGKLLTMFGVFTNFRDWDNNLIDKMRHEFEERGENIRWKGATGDGKTDVYNVFSEAIKNGKPLILPAGEYYISKRLTVDEEDFDVPIHLIGVAPGAVKITGPDSTIIDFSKAKKVYMENIESDKYIKVVTYGEYEADNRDREIILRNVMNTGLAGEPINWYNYINSAAPDNYDDETGGKYSRYPLEIQNWSGYNAIMITNRSYSNEASAIGISDFARHKDGVTALSSPTFLIDQIGALRPFLRFENNGTKLESSGARLALGARVDSSDGGSAQFKTREDNPVWMMIDSANSDKKVQLRYWGGIFSIVVDGTEVFKINSAGEYTNFAPSGVSANIRIRDSSYTRGFQFQRVADNKFRILYTDSDNRMRTAGSAQASEDKGGQAIQLNTVTTSSTRPTLRDADSDRGIMVYDRTLNKPIWWRGDHWIDATGAVV